MQGYVYRIDYTIPGHEGEYYIGKRTMACGNALTDCYFGSGVIAQEYYIKYGYTHPEYFHKTILAYADRFDELAIAEGDFLGDKWKDDDKCINMMPAASKLYEDMSLDSVSLFVKNKRIMMCLTQSELAEKAGVTRLVISELENRKNIRCRLLALNSILFILGAKLGIIELDEGVESINTPFERISNKTLLRQRRVRHR
jgi:hypothetical protein